MKSIYGWSAIEILSSKGLQFIFSIALARMLGPHDFGVISVLLIIISLMQIITDGGFSSALIRNKSISDIQGSTVFVLNFVVSLILIFVIFYLAPIIAVSLDMPEISNCIRVISVTLILNSIGFVARIRLMHELNYKILAISAIFSSVISGGIALYLATKSYAYWALVYQYIISIFISNLIVFLFAGKRMRFIFDYKECRSLFSFGSKIMLAGLLECIFKNINSIMVSKFYSISDVGIYSQAERLASLPIVNITTLIQRVNFQVLVRCEKEQLTQKIYIMLMQAIYIFLPFVIYVSFFSRDIVIHLLGEKWSESIPVLRIIVLGYFFIPLSSILLGVIKMDGRSGLYLRLECIKKINMLILVLLTFKFGIKALALALAFSFFINFILDLVSFANIKVLYELKALYKCLVKLIFVIGISLISRFFNFESLTGFILQSLVYWCIVFLGVFVICKDEIILIKQGFGK